MKIILRRDKMKIYGDVLSAVNSESGAHKVVLTKVQASTRVPFDRLKTYIAELAQLGLIEGETLELTKKGKQYLREYERVLDFMKRMGLAYQQD